MLLTLQVGTTMSKTMTDGTHQGMLIARSADFPAFVVLHHLDELKVARAIRARPDARLVVVQNDGRVNLEEALG